MKLLDQLIVATLVATCSTSANAEEPKQAELFDNLLACRSVSDAAKRLACYDSKVSALDAAAKNDELVVVDRSQIRQARRSLFGLTLPDLGIFGGGKAEREGEGISEIESTIRRAYYSSYRWNIILDDGARWVQIDTRDPARDPRAGQTIRIRRAALGSFLANIEGQRAIRVRREN